jgi:hypothetical protein
MPMGIGAPRAVILTRRCAENVSETQVRSPRPVRMTDPELVRSPGDPSRAPPRRMEVHLSRRKCNFAT